MSQDTPEREIALTPEIIRLARLGAWFVFSVSGGKDSGAAMHGANAWLDSVGHPHDRRLALHADLGRAEWPETMDMVRSVAHHANVPLEIVSQTKDLVWRFEDRWRRSLVRYKALETINMVPPWSSSTLLFCRSEQKGVTLSRHKAKLPGGLPVVGIIGIRREESTKRSKTPISCEDGEMLRRNGRQGVMWHPIAEWTTEEVFAYHERHQIPLHRAYSLGSTRLSCAYCTLASRNDLSVSLDLGGNTETFASYVSLELQSAFSFQTNHWLSDMGTANQVDANRLKEAKAIALERTRHQARVPKELLKAKTIRHIDMETATTLASVRSAIGDLYGIVVEGRTAISIMEVAERG